MTHAPIWQNIESSAFSSTIASSEWMFPTIELVHVVAIVTVIGVIAIMDLRLLGVTSGNRSVAAIERDTLPATWVAFGLAVISGLLLFASKATSYMANPYFLSKMALLLLAGANMAVFHRFVAKDRDRWGMPGVSPTSGAKIAGIVSLALWVAIPFCGRIVGFTLGVYH
jgi:hypothetical protein